LEKEVKRSTVGAAPKPYISNKILKQKG